MTDLVSPERPNKLGTPSKTVVEHRTRLPFSAIAEITEPVSKTSFAVRILNIGRHGCYADSSRVFPTGTLVNLSIRHAALHFQTTATVTHSVLSTGMGFNFANLAAEMESTLQKWIAEVSGPRPEPDRDEVEFISPRALDNTANVMDSEAPHLEIVAPQLHTRRGVFVAILWTLDACLIGWLMSRIWLSLSSLR